MSRIKGKVSWFDQKKGFGVVISDGKEYFIHHSEIITESSNYKNLDKEEEVEFESFKQNENKLCAKKLTGINGGKLNFEKGNNTSKNKKKKRKKYKNTENFDPSHEPSEMRVVIGNGTKKKYGKEIQTRDLVLVNGLFGEESDKTIYHTLLEEVNKSNKNDNLWKLWHGDTHFIVDDNIDWKKSSPTFNMIISMIENYFDMQVKATRFNWYKNSDHWKPYHHDAAAIKPHIAKKQNFTVGISFGSERDVGFENAKNKSVVSFPLPNGSIYCFSRDTNVLWKHGIIQLPESKKHNEGRISIIAWGWVKQTEV